MRVVICTRCPRTLRIRKLMAPLALCLTTVCVWQLVHERMLARCFSQPPESKRQMNDKGKILLQGDIEAENADDTDGEKGFIPDKICAISPPWNQAMPNKELRTDLKDWSFSNTVSCPSFAMETKMSKRAKLSLDCQTDKAEIVSSWSDSSRDVFGISFGDPCLISAIDRCCRDDKPVPNVAHYVWYANNTMEYFQFLSFMSVLRFMKPCLILIHGNHLPSGPYWDYFISLAPNVIHVQRERPTTIFGQNLSFPEHGADVMRIEALMAYGGVYIDWDSVILQPIEPLRMYDFTMGHEVPNFLSNGFLLSKKNASFLQEWYHRYHDYRPIWLHNSLLVPFQISQEKPEIIHIEGNRFNKPNYQEFDQIFKTNYNWTTNYAMHLYLRFYGNATDPKLIRTLNTTIGSVSRHILLGNKELCSN